MWGRALDGGVELRLHEARHAPDLYALIDANRLHLARRFPWVAATRSPGDVRAFIERGLARFAAGDGFEAGLLADGRLVGGLGLHYVRRPENTTEVGYWLAEDAQGRGVVTRALAGLLPWLFVDMDLRRVEIRTEPDNARSRAVPERLGFREEGRLRHAGVRDGRPFDHVVYGLTRDAWRATASGPSAAPDPGPR